MKVKVGFDISQLAHPGGVATYTNNLSQNLQNFNDIEMIYFYSSLRKTYKGDLKNVFKYKIPPSLLEKIFNEFRIISIEKFIGKIDIFHSSDWVQPKTNAKKITTYHDIVPLKYPEWSHPKIVEVHKKRLELVKNEIDKIIAVSKTTKNDLIEFSGIDPSLIEVIYEAPDPVFQIQQEKDIVEFKKKYDLPEEYILAIGGVGKRRNLSKIEKVCHDQNLNLIITGVNIPLLPKNELPLLYAGADLLLYPSLYEGFGLPILEAMKVGIPVITSNVSSMPEVGGEAAYYINPESDSEMKEALKTVLNEKNTRQDLIKKGFNQANKFSWEITAQKTHDLYFAMLEK